MLRTTQQPVTFTDSTSLVYSYGGTTRGNAEPKLVETSIQNDMLTTQDRDTQTVLRKRHVNIQVNEQNLRQTALIQSLQRQKEDEDPEQAKTQLSLFIKNQLGKVLEALEENGQPQVPQLQDYIFQRESLDQVINEPLKARTMVLKEKALHQEHQHTVTAIQFNCSAMLCAVAVSLTQHQHSGSCNSTGHKGHIYLFNLSLANQPPVVVSYPACINSLRFHPIKPNVLWAGTMTGQVLVLDTSLEKVIMESKIDDYFHRESIVDLLFFHQKHQNQNIYNLGSVSADGKILLWDMKDFNKAQQQIAVAQQDISQFNLLESPAKGYMLLKKRDNQVNLVGISCVAQHRQNDQLVVVGSETGQVYRAFIKNIVYAQDKTQRALVINNTPKHLQWAESTLQLLLNLLPKNILDVKLSLEQYCIQKQVQGTITPEHLFQSRPDLRKVFQNPMDFIFEQHLGPVHSLAFSSFLPNIFVSASYDGILRLYDVYHNKSLLQHHMEHNHFLSVQWSPSRPGLLFTITSDYSLSIYDLSSSSPFVPVLSCCASATALALNSRQPELIAIPFQDFRVSVMTLDHALLEPRNEEVTQLNSLLQL